MSTITTREEYLQAQKAGQKLYRKKIMKGEYPYLPVLGDMLSASDISEEMPLGVMSIPIRDIVGTYSDGRTHAFAPNFMPVLDYDSEFGMKWSSLYDYQIETGISDPIKVYEYMHKYYVVEGHKRVSVLKYLGAPTIPAEVTRKMPKKTDDEENSVYYEYVDFFDKTRLNYLHFSKTGSYGKFLQLIGREDGNLSDDDRHDLSFFHTRFERVFNSLSDKSTSEITDDDAMLFFLSIYPFQKSRDLPETKIKEKLVGIWSEISILSEDDPVKIKTEEETKKNIVSSVFNSILSNKHKVAFIYDKEPESSSHIYGHELGRIQVNEYFDNNVETNYFVISPEDKKADKKLEKLCEDNYDILFIVAPGLINAAIKVSAKYPSVNIFTCQLGSPHNKVMSYYTRIYEAKFLIGMIAGALTDNDKIGYIADSPIYGTLSSINAFALGAKMVNPYARIYLSWTSAIDDDHNKLFWDEDINIISTRDMIRPDDDSRKFGLYSVKDGVKTGLAMSAYHWGNFYIKLIEGINNGSVKNNDSSGAKAINYWWGFSSDVIDLICSEKLPDETITLIRAIKSAIKNDIFNPFTGIIRNQTGDVVVEKDEVLLPEDIMVMDYLIDNVCGDIPTLDQIEDSQKKIVELLGVTE